MSSESEEHRIEDRFADVVANYVHAVHEVATEAQRRQWEAAREYSRAAQEQYQAAVGEGTRGYPYVVQEVPRDWQDAARTYQQALQETAEDVARRQEEAFRGYIAGLKEAWGAVDPAAIDPATIVATAQAMTAAWIGQGPTGSGRRGSRA